MTTEEFQKELASHDWHYEMSDDPRYYHAGDFNRHRLESLCEKNPEFKVLYDTEKKRHGR